MVFFIHIILFDAEHGVAMTNGHTVLVTDKGCEALSKRGTELVIR